MSEITPLPWVVEGPFESEFTIVQTNLPTDEWQVIASVPIEVKGYQLAQANAEYIVRACNNFPALAEALGNLIDACDGNYVELVDEAKTALAKAQQEEPK